MLSLPASDRAAYIDQIAQDNAAALSHALEWCALNGIGAFRINSQFLPLYTHPQAGYSIEDLSRAAAFKKMLSHCRTLAKNASIRLSFHPDQFVVPGSTSVQVVENSLRELEYQARLCDLLGADQITLHGGGAYGDKPSALKRLVSGLDRLSPRARKLIALENDDRVFTPADLLPICQTEGIPFIYDVHHHRCLPDSLSVGEVSQRCFRSWGSREPWCHISSPLTGWKSKDPRNHSDFINPRDWPKEWDGQRLTVDIEAKAKELAVVKFLRWLLKHEQSAVSAT